MHLNIPYCVVKLNRDYLNDIMLSKNSQKPLLSSFLNSQPRADVFNKQMFLMYCTIMKEGLTNSNNVHVYIFIVSCISSMNLLLILFQVQEHNDTRVHVSWRLNCTLLKIQTIFNFVEVSSIIYLHFSDFFSQFLRLDRYKP